MSLAEDIKKKLKINDKNLNAELIEQPGLFARYAFEMSKKKQEFDELELELDILEAETDKRVRNKFLANDEKISEKKVEMEIMVDPKIKELKREVIKVNSQYYILKGITQAYSQRKDLLISLCANLREEMKSDINLREKE